MRTLVVGCLAFLSIVLIALASRGDVWMQTKAGFYVVTTDNDGEPIVTKATNVTDYVVVNAPDDDPDGPDDPVDPPSEDTWGLVAFSAEEVQQVEDPNRNENAAKVAAVYVEVGKLFRDGKIPEARLGTTIDLLFAAALGDSAEHWKRWKDEVSKKYNELNFQSPADGGQGLIDIGLGAGSTSTAAIGDWIAKFIEALPIIIQLIELLGDDVTFAEILPLILQLFEIFLASGS